jgi:glutathionylspermidine synthase
MQRRAIAPRPGWEAIIEEQGLVFWRTLLDDGAELSYWHESAYYALRGDEVDELERVARELVTEQLVAVGDHIVEHDLFARLGIPVWAVPRIKETWESEPPMLYGRFDFAYGPDEVPKLLEFNADTPTGLLETAIQWHWLEDRLPGADQWNRVHEALVERWRELAGAGRLPGDRLHLVCSGAEPTGEDLMTIGYLAETASEAGLTCHLMPIDDIRVAPDGAFVDADDRPIRTAFKLYPWEWLVHEASIDRMLLRMGDQPGETVWIEPIWKMLWSNKGILPLLWELFPGHPNLLPAYFADDPRAATLTDAVRKPLLSREGADTTILRDGVAVETGPEVGYGAEGFVLQQFTDLGDHDGAHPVLGVWIVDMEPQGLGIRESDNLITNDASRFVPHAIES